MNIFILFVFIFLQSCASNNSDARKSSKVLSALMASGMTPAQNGDTRLYRAENVSCLRELTKEVWKCGFTSNGRTYEIPSRESAALSEILFELPVAKGDSGAATPFIGCRTNDGDSENASCDIAVPLDPVI